MERASKYPQRRSIELIQARRWYQVARRHDTGEQKNLQKNLDTSELSVSINYLDRAIQRSDLTVTHNNAAELERLGARSVVCVARRVGEPTARRVTRSAITWWRRTSC